MEGGFTLAPKKDFLFVCVFLIRVSAPFKKLIFFRERQEHSTEDKKIHDN